MTRILPCVLASALALAACKASPAGPSNPNPSPQATRILNLSGDLSFGQMRVGSFAHRAFTASNTGTDTITLSGISAPNGFATTFDPSSSSRSVFTFSPSTFHVMFMPRAAGTLSGALNVTGNQTSTVGQLTTSGTGFVDPGHAAHIFTGDISNGDAHCFSGSRDQFDDGPCKTFSFATTTAGRIDAAMVNNDDDALLVLELIDINAKRQLSRGDLSFDPYPGNNAYRLLNSTLQPGSYQLRVTIISTSKIAPFTVVAAYPN